jgi:hypothetical protein
MLTLRWPAGRRPRRPCALSVAPLPKSTPRGIRVNTISPASSSTQSFDKGSLAPAQKDNFVDGPSLAFRLAIRARPPKSIRGPLSGGHRLFVDDGPLVTSAVVTEGSLSKRALMNSG